MNFFLDSFKKFNIRKVSLYEPFETIYLTEMKNQHNNPIQTNTTKQQNLSLLKWGRISFNQPQFREKKILPHNRWTFIKDRDTIRTRANSQGRYTPISS